MRIQAKNQDEPLTVHLRRFPAESPEELLAILTNLSGKVGERSFGLFRNFTKPEAMP
ncbi:hypothetical protein N656DRAFT_425522 [Canariomyces notabilis]|uniref:Uncharacterized protein n=1 Tax=Canariomyces notabilis TaxID=2074819 RepID=A0AAN6QEA6_9PEZI|nr:hypothetical protein N656DRAFT_425522 [Canariomyces arenarius]